MAEKPDEADGFEQKIRNHSGPTQPTDGSAVISQAARRTRPWPPGKLSSSSRLSTLTSRIFDIESAFFEICYPAGLRRQPNLVRSIRTAWKLQMAA